MTDSAPARRPIEVDAEVCGAGAHRRQPKHRHQRRAALPDRGAPRCRPRRATTTDYRNGRHRSVKAAGGACLLGCCLPSRKRSQVFVRCGATQPATLFAGLLYTPV
jgi:hypothetical protein